MFDENIFLYFEEVDFVKESNPKMEKFLIVQF